MAGHDRDWRRTGWRRFQMCRGSAPWMASPRSDLCVHSLVSAVLGRHVGLKPHGGNGEEGEERDEERHGV